MSINNTPGQSIIQKYNFSRLVSCKCENFHSFYVYYKKGFKICFYCNNIINCLELADIYKNNNYCFRCSKCETAINVNKDYFKINDKKAKFKCSDCFAKKQSHSYAKLIDATNIKDKNKLNVLDKLSKIKAVVNDSQKTDFYYENFGEINELEKFVNYLIVSLNFFPPKSKEFVVVNNFLDYFDNMLQIALNNNIIYDIYQFKKECNIYGDDYQNNEFLSEKFNKFYSQLLIKCSKKKFLSLEMLKYLHDILYKLDLAMPLDNYFLINQFFTKRKENIQNKILNYIGEKNE